MDASYHTPVLIESVLQYLPTTPDGLYVDGTLGGGGHSEQLLDTLSPKGRVVGFDQDIEAITFSRMHLQRFGERVSFVHDNTANIRNALHMLNVHHIDGFLLDLGVSSHQIDEATRGFSFQKNDRIDMRMNREQHVDGWAVVNTYSHDQLANIFWQYGEERASRKIANSIIQRRSSLPINTTQQLVEAIEQVSSKRFLTKTLARVFQAIRIEVNDELNNLQKTLREVLEIVRPGGRIVVISYHSLEDRIVKTFFKDNARDRIHSHNKLVPDTLQTPRLKILTKKPIEADADESRHNSRASSAKLRAAERL